MAFSPNFEAGNRAEDPRVAVVVAEWLRRWTRNPLGSPRAARICARAPLPTESRHAAGPFCVRTAGAASREPVARRDRIVVSTLRCGRSNPGSNPGHGSQLRRGRPAPFRHLTLQLGFAPTFGRHPVLPASSQERRRPSARRSRGREVKAMDLKSIGVSPRRFEPCRLRAAVRALPLAFCADSCAFQVQESDSQFMAFSPNFEAGNRAEDPRVAVVVAEWLRRWTRNPLGSPRAARICARAPLPTESRHAADPFCVRTAGTASREPVARRDRIVVSTLRCGRSNPGSNPGHGSQLRRGRPAPFRHLTLQLGFAPTFGRHPVLPASSQESRRPSARRSRGREVKAMDLKSIGVSPRRFEPCRLRAAVRALPLAFCADSCAFQVQESDSQFMAFSPNFEAGNRAEDPRVAVVVAEWLRRWTRNPLGSPRAARICARAPLPTESRHAAGPFCVRTAGTASREPVARRDRIVVSTLRCGRSNPGSNPGHGSQLRRGRPAPFRHLTLQLGFAPTFGRHPVLPASSQESRRPSARRSRGREVKAMDLKSIGVSPRRFEPCRLRAAVRALPLAFCADSCAFQVQESDSQFMAFSPNFEAGNRAEDPRVAVVVAEWLRRWTRNPLGSPRAARICARAPLPTESRHAAGPFCVRTAGAASREPVARRDRIVVSTLRCGRSNPGSNPGHGSQLRRGRPAPFRHLTLQLGFAPTFGRHPVLPASSQERRRPSARRSRGREVKAMDLKSIGVSPRRFEPCRLRAAVRALPLAFCADSCAFQVQESDSQFMAFSPNFEAGNRAEDPRVAVVVAECTDLRARPLPTESRHAADPFCVRTAGTASREPVARRDRIVVSTLRCGRSNPGSNPGHGSQLRRGRPAPFRHLTLQLGFAPTFGRHPVLPASSQESRRPSARRSRGREVKAMDLKSIGVSPRRFEPCRLRAAVRALPLAFCADSCAFQVQESDSQFMAFSPNFEAGNRAEDPRVAVVVAEWLRRWTRNPLGSPRAARICARAPLPTESRHAAGPFCVRTAGTASREPVARRDRIVVSTLRCGRSNPGSNPGHGSQLRRGRPAPFRHLTLQLGFAPTFGRHPVLPASSQESRRPSARRSRGREVKAMDLKSIGVSPRRFEPCRLRAAVRALPLAFCADSCAFQVQESDSQFMAFSPNFEAGNRAEDPRVAVVVAEWLRRWTRNPLGSPRAARICARAPLPTESRHAAGPFCVRTAGTASREPVARRDRIVVSTLRCGRSNPGSNPGHGSQLRRGRPAPFRHLTLQLGFAPTFGRHPVLPASSQESRRPSARRSRGREVKAMDLKSIGVSPRRFEPCRLTGQGVQESDSQFMAFSPNFEAGNRAEDPRVAVVVAEWLRRWTRNPLGSPRAARICARAPLPTESRHAAGPFCVRTAGTASREPVARRDRIVVSTLRCGRSNPGSNPGHGSQLRRGRPAPFRHLTLQLGFAPTFGRHPVLPASSQESRRPSARRSRGREVKAMDLKSIGVSPRRFEPCRLRAAVRALPLAFCADSCAFQVL
ncbi:hypothetical protein QQF64_016498 [Cirrhinus molitorella]|uniref:Uncharacterized protein n=1 Tax=Cirrhinus molitorella TaxID=172907 RepID=A0ABR3LMZ1_9TELE